MQHLDVLEAAPHPGTDDLRFFVGPDAAVVILVPAGSGDDDELLVRSARHLDELFNDARAVHTAPADDHEGALGWSVFGRILKGARRAHGEREEQQGKEGREESFIV